MFEEKEPGKPQNWAMTVTVIVIISLINVCIFVVIRVLLDSENEFDEPIVQGQLRDDLTKFLGIFSLTFCFGCWCCFCCSGNCYKIFCLCNPKRMNFGHCWAHIIGHKIQKTRIHMRNTLRRKMGTCEVDVIELEEGNRTKRYLEFEQNLYKNKHSTAKLSQFGGEDYERKVSAMPSFDSNNNDTEVPSSSSTSLGREDVTVKISSSTESKSSNASSVVLEMASSRFRKNSQQEKRRKNEVGVLALVKRRWSITPDGSAIAMDLATSNSRPKRPNVLPGLLTGSPMPVRHELSPMNQRDRNSRSGSTVAVRNVDFLQVPVQNLTPMTVAIMDKGRMNMGFDHHDDDENDEIPMRSPSPIVSPNSPEESVSMPQKEFTEIDINK